MGRGWSRGSCEPRRDSRLRADPDCSASRSDNLICHSHQQQCTHKAPTLRHPPGACIPNIPLLPRSTATPRCSLCAVVLELRAAASWRSVRRLSEGRVTAAAKLISLARHRQPPPRNAYSINLHPLHTPLVRPSLHPPPFLLPRLRPPSCPTFQPTCSLRWAATSTLRPHHPLNIIKERIEAYFVHQLPQSASPTPIDIAAAASPFRVFDSLPPRVSVRSNFDELLVPPSHPSRRSTDTYYFNETECLRTHTSAHQTAFLRRGVDSFLVFGDCYRRDEIDASHYPVFHQVEGVRVWQASSERQQPTSEWIVTDLQRTLDGLVSHLFGPSTPRRWLDDSFPFTSPSLQVEVQFHGRWLEVLGCGVIQPAICRHFGTEAGGSTGTVAGWAFGLGLERLAMVLFDIHDIRLFWSDDPRFHQQFMPAASPASPHAAAPPPAPASFRPIRFQPFSKYPPCPKDLSFFVPESFHENDLSSVIRSVAGDWVESVQLVETFTHPVSGKESRLYRIVYRSMSHSLTNEQVNVLHNQVRQQLQEQINLQLR